MSKDNKNKFTETLKLFDNKDYKTCKKECIKILDKNPTYIEVLALKGITEAHLGEKEQGLKDLKDAIKMKFSNPIPWHFLALYYKEEKDYSQAMKNYTMALKHDINNFNILREQYYLQLYLRLYESFFESSRKGLEMKSNLVVNWVTYVFASYLIENYEFSDKILDSTIRISLENIKPNELLELRQFKVRLLLKLNKPNEAISYMKENEKDFSIDKIRLNEEYFKIQSFVINDNKSNLEAIENVDNLILINNENMEYLLWKLRVMFIHSNTIPNDIMDLFTNKVKDFTSLLIACEENPSFQKYAYDFVSEISKSDKLSNTLKKSRVFSRLNLALLSNDDFINEFYKYTKHSIETCNPSIFSNIKWIYDYQSKSKLPIICNLVTKLATELKEKSSIFDSDIVPHIAWFNFFAANHYRKIYDMEAALYHINKSIDSTPSVVEFFELKSKILQKSFLFKEADKSYNKARLLDVGDRYLNAKHAKISIRSGDFDNCIRIMKEFVKNPLLDENIDHIQTCWFVIESAWHFLKSGSLPQAERMTISIINIFQSIFDDQFDFYNYCLRRSCINTFAESMEYMDRVFDSNNVYKALELINYLYDAFDTADINKEKDFIGLNETVFKDTKYKFKSYSDSKVNLMNSVYSNVILKLQAYSKKDSLHYICVKFSLLKGKCLIALKSLNYLKLYSYDSCYYNAALALFADFLLKNPNIDNLYKEVIDQSIPELKSADEAYKQSRSKLLKEVNLIKESKEASLNSVLTSKSISIFYFHNDKSMIKEFIANITSRKLEDIKYLSFKNYSRLLVLVSLFLNDTAKDQFINDIKSKYEFLASPDKTIYNLDLYEVFNEDRKPKYTDK